MKRFTNFSNVSGAILHVFSNVDGTQHLPVTDGILVSDDMYLGYQSGVMDITFYDANNNIVTPSAGECTPQMLSILGKWMAPSVGDAVIDATLCGEEASFNLPTFLGPSAKARMKLSGIGANVSYCMIAIWRV